MRGKEFVYRVGDYMHVSEFLAMIKTQLSVVVPADVKVVVTSDSTSSAVSDADSDSVPPTVVVVMTSLKMVRDVQLSANATGFYVAMSDAAAEAYRFSGVMHDSVLEPSKSLMAAPNQVSQFKFSVPFTLEPGRQHAKTIDKQWKRTTILSVAEPFPCAVTRQEVIKRELKELSPIEVCPLMEYA